MKASPRICDLGLSVARPPISTAVRRLHRELHAAGIRLRPFFYLSNEYGCVVRTANVGLLWVDALPQIPALWRRHRHATRDADLLIRILRHETGHAFCYVHRLWRRPDFRKLFGVRGHFFGTYPDAGWTPSAADEKRLQDGEHINVRCLKHPDEDFAITFQTFVNPEEDWRRRWRHAPGVMRKLEFVEAMAAKHGPIAIRGDGRDLDMPIEEITTRVAEWPGLALRAEAPQRRASREGAARIRDASATNL
jgi:hypothetical protein